MRSTAWSRRLTEAVRNKARPFFGICVGMQLMATRGKEHVTTDGFNWIAATSRRSRRARRT